MPHERTEGQTDLRLAPYWNLTFCATGYYIQFSGYQVHRLPGSVKKLQVQHSAQEKLKHLTCNLLTELANLQTCKLANVLKSQASLRQNA